MDAADGCGIGQEKHEKWREGLDVKLKKVQNNVKSEKKLATSQTILKHFLDSVPACYDSRSPETRTPLKLQLKTGTVSLCEIPLHNLPEKNFI